MEILQVRHGQFRERLLQDSNGWLRRPIQRLAPFRGGDQLNVTLVRAAPTPHYQAETFKLTSEIAGRGRMDGERARQIANLPAGVLTHVGERPELSPADSRAHLDGPVVTPDRLDDDPEQLEYLQHLDRLGRNRRVLRHGNQPITGAAALSTAGRVVIFAQI